MPIIPFRHPFPRRGRNASGRPIHYAKGRLPGSGPYAFRAEWSASSDRNSNTRVIRFFDDEASVFTGASRLVRSGFNRFPPTRYRAKTAIGRRSISKQFLQWPAGSGGPRGAFIQPENQLLQFFEILELTTDCVFDIFMASLLMTGKLTSAKVAPFVQIIA